MTLKKTKMKTIPCFCISILLVIVHQVSAQHYDIKSPDGNIQITMKLYEDILTDANTYGLAITFHGCTLPRGWEKCTPIT